MATTLITSLAAVRFTSDIPDLVFSTDGTRTEVAIGMYGRDILHEDYYAYNGRVTVRDIRSVIEQEMRSNNDIYATVTITAGNYRTTMGVIYCSMAVVNFNQPMLGTCFLTTLQAKQLPRDPLASDYLCFYASKDMTEEVWFHITYIGKDEELPTTISVQAGTVHAQNECVLVYSLKCYTLMQHCPEGSKILLATVEIGGKSMTYYFTDETPNLMLWFRNAFNCPEIALLTCKTSEVAKADRSVALVGGTSRFYDQKDSKSYEVETAPLALEQARWLEQLVLSHDVAKMDSFVDIEDDDFGNMQSVIITDSTCEIQDGDEELNRIKFTWQYARNTPHLAMPQDNGRVFNDTFTQSFS